MNLPFTVEQFLEVFARYNEAIWPAQILLNALALAALGVAGYSIACRLLPHIDRLITGFLGVLWIWTGLVYHLIFFAPINPAARIFGAAFLAQGLAFLVLAWRRPLVLRAITRWRTGLGAALLLYGLVLYPTLGYLLGHRYPSAPTFGAPCPMVIFTFGLLLWADRLPRALVILPFLWSLLGFTAALALGIREDVGLLVSGVVGTTVLLMPERALKAEG